MTLQNDEIQALGVLGYFARASFLGTSDARAVHAEASALVEAGRLRPAAIRRGADRTLAPDIRGDLITWVTTPEPGTALRRLWEAFSTLGEQLSSGAYLGLGRFDLQLAWYSGAGEFYARHLDAFPGQSNRRITAIYYLNPEWQPSHGGRLRLYSEHGPLEVELDRLVVFRSELLEHEVLPAHAPRLALTAWYYGPDAR
jgi:SM-20-related protein